MRRIEPLSVRMRRAAARHPYDDDLDRFAFEVERLEVERDDARRRVEHLVRISSINVAVACGIVLTTLIARIYFHCP